MRKYLLPVLIISFVFFPTPAIQAASDVEATIDEGKQAVGENPDDTAVHFDRGVEHLRSGMYKEAIESLKQVVRINPDAVSHYNLGFVYDRTGRYKEAIEVYKRAIFINPDYIDAYNKLGNAYGELGMYKEAVETLKVAIERDPEHAMSYYNLGLIYNSSNDKDSAMEQHEILNGLNFDLAEKLFELIRK
ncbi:MAG: Cell division coordinator CpoB [Candidatus Scalindua arabica]|uniref:Cell division coordinator CpoB n=1 Tax=Candidatus Scalindua arabica TaxID=1127984 RepID=A0A941W138_9BACT|nr:Cell division coordinator CpoB [Candidatus Scalindua arabica]